MTSTMQLISSPSTLGLPSQFQEFRPTQVEALERILATDKKWILLQAPTGTGKTLVMAAMQRILNTRALYACHTKQLEDQVKTDFPYAAILKGRSNYPTLRYSSQFPRINVSLCTKRKEGHCRWCCDGRDQTPDSEGLTCSAISRCPYHIAKANALSSTLTIINTAFLLTEANFVGAFSGWPWLVLDEAELIEDSLMGFITFSAADYWFSRLNLPAPRLKTVVGAWIEWANEIAIPRIDKRLDELRNTWGIQDIKEEERLESARRKITFFAEDASKNPWVYDEKGSNLTFKPVFISRYADSYLWRHADRFLCMSATLSPDQFCRDLSIPRDQAAFIDLPSPFNPKRRPIYYIPAVSMTYDNKAASRAIVTKAVDVILDIHPQLRTLIHTVSRDLAVYLVANSTHKSRMVHYTDGMSREEALETFIKDSGPRILVAQSMDRGVDLPGDLCRLIIIPKVPYPDLSDKQIARRVYGSKDGNAWYAVRTLRTLVQMSGRGMRSEDDWSLVYILDSQFGDALYRKWKGIIPGWWKEALVMSK